MLRIALAMLAATALLLAPGAAAAQAPAETAPILRVVGHGTAQVTPDSAELFASVRRVDRDRDTARADVNRRTARLLAALERLGVPQADVQTSGVSVSRRTYEKAPRVRWAARSSLTIVLRDVAATGAVVDALVAAGADDVDGPSFAVTNPSAGLAAAEQAALADARTRADATAATLGLRVVGVRSVDLSPDEGGDLPVFEAATASGPPSRAADTPIEPGRQRVDASVAVVYVLGPAA